MVECDYFSRFLYGGVSMSRIARLFSLVLILVLIVSVTPQALAQDGEYIISPTFGSGPGTLHPLFCQDTTCADLIGRMYYGLVGVNPQTMKMSQVLWLRTGRHPKMA
jgi:hypothetical protein